MVYIDFVQRRNLDNMGVKFLLQTIFVLPTAKKDKQGCIARYFSQWWMFPPFVLSPRWGVPRAWLHPRVTACECIAIDCKHFICQVFPIFIFILYKAMVVSLALTFESVNIFSPTLCIQTNSNILSIRSTQANDRPLLPPVPRGGTGRWCPRTAVPAAGHRLRRPLPRGSVRIRPLPVPQRCARKQARCQADIQLQCLTCSPCSFRLRIGFVTCWMFTFSI